jgi:hypothetical protein
MPFRIQSSHLQPRRGIRCPLGSDQSGLQNQVEWLSRIGIRVLATPADACSYFASSRVLILISLVSPRGPIKKDKTFFIDYQARRQRKGVAFNGFVPTAAMRTEIPISGVPPPEPRCHNPYSGSPNGRDPFK